MIIIQAEEYDDDIKLFTSKKKLVTWMDKNNMSFDGKFRITPDTEGHNYRVVSYHMLVNE